ncbi:hypothetical protein KM043_006512 [Ampulex compressa]|nr:hypothetical protein KM043_006512 [Ampulex compressa]
MAARAEFPLGTFGKGDSREDYEDRFKANGIIVLLGAFVDIRGPTPGNSFVAAVGFIPRYSPKDVPIDCADEFFESAILSCAKYPPRMRSDYDERSFQENTLRDIWSKFIVPT